MNDMFLLYLCIFCFIVFLLAIFFALLNICDELEKLNKTLRKRNRGDK